MEVTKLKEKALGNIRNGRNLPTSATRTYVSVLYIHVYTDKNNRFIHTQPVKFF